MSYETTTAIAPISRHDLATSEGLVGAAIELTENYVEGMKTLLAKWVNDGHGSVQEFAEATGRSYSQMRKYAADLRKEKVIAPSPKAPKQVRQKQAATDVFANEQIEPAQVIDVDVLSDEDKAAADAIAERFEQVEATATELLPKMRELIDEQAARIAELEKELKAEKYWHRDQTQKRLLADKRNAENLGDAACTRRELVAVEKQLDLVKGQLLASADASETMQLGLPDGRTLEFEARWI